MQRPDEEFAALVAEVVGQERWVADGNYRRVRPLVWDRADTIFWLNYAFPRVLWQALARTLHRAFTHEELFSGNRESFRKAFMSRDSILCWVVTTFHRRRRQYRALLDGGAYRDLTPVEFRRHRDAEAFLQRLTSERRGAPR